MPHFVSDWTTELHLKGLLCQRPISMDDLSLCGTTFQMLSSVCKWVCLHVHDYFVASVHQVVGPMGQMVRTAWPPNV